MKEKGPIRKPPTLIIASERNPGRGKDVFLTCSLLDEIEIRRIRRAISYKIVPQMFLSPTSLKIAISLIENDIHVASKTQQIQTDTDYRVEGQPIKITFRRDPDERISIRAKVKGYDVVQSESSEV